MDASQREQLSTWAGALAQSDDSERRSMGRALMMTLERIDELERELARQIVADQPVPAAPPPPEMEREEEPEPAPEEAVSEDTQPIGLRGRLRAQASRLHDR
jgi:hypothetical protein